MRLLGDTEDNLSQYDVSGREAPWLTGDQQLIGARQAHVRRTDHPSACSLLGDDVVEFHPGQFSPLGFHTARHL